jgi:Fic family protein
MEKIDESIFEFLSNHPLSSSKEIFDGIATDKGYATIKRTLNHLIELDFLVVSGNGKGTKYKLSNSFIINRPIRIDTYFEKEIDERDINQSYNFSLLSEILPTVSLFNSEEIEQLNNLQGRYQANISKLTPNQYQKELERLAIDLSWKSSQIEGNTYSLLETERLLNDKLTANGKTQFEATMLLNHKAALDFIIENPDYLNPVQLNRIEDIHSMLVKDLDVERNIRKHRVGISGTNYKPLDSDFQIIEAIQQMCHLVNSKQNVFEKALLLLVLISYIQPFDDGNKRTARIISNACLIHHKHCPISFRTADSIEYKKAMLLFYEQNNISAIKAIFIDQFEFAVNTYF